MGQSAASSVREVTDWQLTYHDWHPEHQPLREALCTLGNGVICTRGAFAEVDLYDQPFSDLAANSPHYPGTYLEGGYNRAVSHVAGQTIENEDLVNWPNWLPLSFRPEGGAWFRIDEVELLSFRQTLDVRAGMLERELDFRDAQGREFHLLSRRIVHMQQPNLVAECWELTPRNWSGIVELASGLNGGVTNSGVARYRDLESRHLDVIELNTAAEDVIFLTARTRQSQQRMCQAARTRVRLNDRAVATGRELDQTSARITQRLQTRCEQGVPLRIEKVVAICTTRDRAISTPQEEAVKRVRRAGTFADLLRTHKQTWEHLWRRADIQFSDGENEAPLILRLHLFHLLQTVSRNTIDRDTGVPSRGWHGEAYRGHILWDELFVFPILNLRMPEVSRSLLMYRYRRLGEARAMAQQSGHRGAMFPWQSGSDGREESQVWHLNPRSGRWVPDNTHLQRHVNAAIAYNIWQYYQCTGDREFLRYYGAEMLLLIARFWASATNYHEGRDRYEIRSVVGPDEFHTAYPDAAPDQPGLNNNAYTNVMAAWTIRTALAMFFQLPQERQQELREQLNLSLAELDRWQRISRRMFVPFHEDGLISQFEGYAELAELDWHAYQQKYGDLQRLDRILESEGDSVNRYKVSKQADVLMLFYLFSSEELTELFCYLGYHFQKQQIPRNIDYYRARTSHGSTLSRVVFSWVAARSGREQGWELFQSALRSDIEDVQGGTTSEGIHLGAMAGTVDLIQRCFTGLEARDDVLRFKPRLPRELQSITFRLRYRGHWLQLHLQADRLVLRLERGPSPAVTVAVRDEVCQMLPGQTRTFSLASSG